ncbi:hypothetical protein AAHH78_37035, partial [Burkholderia pseudomallei]
SVDAGTVVASAPKSRRVPNALLRRPPERAAVFRRFAAAPAAMRRLARTDARGASARRKYVDASHAEPLPSRRLDTWSVP